MSHPAAFVGHGDRGDLQPGPQEFSVQLGSQNHQQTARPSNTGSRETQRRTGEPLGVLEILGGFLKEFPRCWEDKESQLGE